MDGVVLAPSALGMTFVCEPSITATQELVVPRSIPITFAIVLVLSCAFALSCRVLLLYRVFALNFVSQNRLLEIYRKILAGYNPVTEIFIPIYYLYISWLIRFKPTDRHCPLLL